MTEPSPQGVTAILVAIAEVKGQVGTLVDGQMRTVRDVNSLNDRMRHVENTQATLSNMPAELDKLSNKFDEISAWRWRSSGVAAALGAVLAGVPATIVGYVVASK